MARLKFNRTAVAWGVVFGVLATATGMFLLEAVEGGFVAEGFFLIVLSWVIVLVIVAKMFQVVAKWSRREEGE